MKFWNFKNVERDPDGQMPNGGPGTPDGLDGELEISGEIVADGSWFDEEGVCVAREFREALKGYRNVTVRINSPGGDVMAGADIYSALREHSLNGRGKIRIEVAALAASAASVIAMAGDEILMYPTAYMMIHNPWTLTVGDSRELRKAARTLDVISEGLINAYQIRTGKSRDELKRMLDGETWMSAWTCVDEGFADGVIGAEDGDVPAAACLMSGKAHGWQEIAARIRDRAEDPEEPEKPEAPEKEEPEAPEAVCVNGALVEAVETADASLDAKAADADPEETEKPEEDPEETEKPEEDPEEKPEEDPEEEEEPEKDPDSEDLAVAAIDAQTRARFINFALDAWEESCRLEGGLG